MSISAFIIATFSFVNKYDKVKMCSTINCFFNGRLGQLKQLS